MGTQTLTIPASSPAQSSVCFEVNIEDDPYIEPEERISVLLESDSTGVYRIVGDGSLSIRIVDNDGEYIYLSFFC